MPIEMNVFKVNLEFTQDILGSVSRNKDMFTAWVKSKAPEGSDEEETPEFLEEKSWTGFYMDEKGPYVMDYQLKGFFKKSAIEQPEVLGIHKKKKGSEEEFASARTIKGIIDGKLFIRPRRMHLGVKPEVTLDTFQRPLRADTMRGPRIALAKSDIIKAGTKISFEVHTLPNSGIGLEQVQQLLDYGEYQGLGQFRNGGWGTFLAKTIFLHIVEIKRSKKDDAMMRGLHYMEKEKRQKRTVAK